MKELEEKRINKEMANIRKKFKGLSPALQCFMTCINMNQIRREFGWIPEEEVCSITLSIRFRYSKCLRYVAKVIFTYILGYKVDVGHMEAVNLISSSKYSEKQIVRAHRPSDTAVLNISHFIAGIPRRHPFDA